MMKEIEMRQPYENPVSRSSSAPGLRKRNLKMAPAKKAPRIASTSSSGDSPTSTKSGEGAAAIRMSETGVAKPCCAQA